MREVRESKTKRSINFEKMSDAGVEISALWDLAPSTCRVDEIDSMLRLRLADSFEYLGGLPWLEAGERATVTRAALENLYANELHAVAKKTPETRRKYVSE